LGAPPKFTAGAGIVLTQVSDGLTISTTVNPVQIAATTHTMAAPREYFFCTTATACSVTLPVPAAGYEFCVRMDNNVSANITIAGQDSVYVEAPARTGWGTIAHGLVTTTAAVTNQICLVGYDATHYAVMNYTGDFGAN
jgi:hypothetical protein